MSGAERGNCQWVWFWSSRSDCDIQDQDDNLIMILIFKITTCWWWRFFKSFMRSDLDLSDFQKPNFEKTGSRKARKNC